MGPQQDRALPGQDQGIGQGRAEPQGGVVHQSGHLGVANSAGLAAAGVGPDTPDPEGGLIVRDRRGAVMVELSGAAAERASDLGIRRIALTFDLCEQPYEIAGYQGDIVDFLRDRDIAATFFAGGKWLLTHAERAGQLMSDDRFEIANHAWEHRNLRLLSGTRLATEIDGEEYEEVFATAIGVYPGYARYRRASDYEAPIFVLTAGEKQ